MSGSSSFMTTSSEMVPPRLPPLVATAGEHEPIDRYPKRDDSDVFLGTDLVSGFEVWVPRKLLNWHVKGSMGQGKTARVFLRAIKQLARKYKAKGKTFQDSIVVIDCGGDLSLRANAEKIAKENGLRYKIISLDARCSHFMPPFQSVDKENSNPIVDAQVTLDGLQCVHDPNTHAAGYYLQAMFEAMAAFVKIGSRDATIEDAVAFLHKNKKRFPDADRVRMVLGMLSAYPQIGRGPTRESEVWFEDVLTEPTMLFVSSPTPAQPVVAPIIASLVLSNLRAEAVRLKHQGVKTVSTHCFIDEAQEVISQSFGATYAHARKYLGAGSRENPISGGGIYLAHQFDHQLNSNNVDLRHSIPEGSDVRVYFTCVGDDITAMQNYSRDTIMELKSFSSSGLNGSNVSNNPSIVPLLSRDTCLKATSTPGHAICHIRSRDDQHDEPFVISIDFDCPDLSHVPLPEIKHTIPDGTGSTTTVTAETPLTPEQVDLRCRITKVVRDAMTAMAIDLGGTLTMTDETPKQMDGGELGIQHHNCLSDAGERQSEPGHRFDSDIWLRPLRSKVRAFEFEQIASYYHFAMNPTKAVRAAFSRQIAKKTIVVTNVMSLPPLSLSEPLFAWSPGEPEPDQALFGSIAWKTRNRIKESVKELTLVQALPIDRVIRRDEVTHDLMVAGLYLSLEQSKKEIAASWISEATLKAANIDSLQGILPDALVTGLRGPLALDVVGTAYNKTKLIEMHAAYREAAFPYALY